MLEGSPITSGFLPVRVALVLVAEGPMARLTPDVLLGRL
jgi:hypothetical protein